MCQVLIISDLWIFINFRKYDRVLNMRCDAIKEEVWIFQDSDFLRKQALHKVLNIPEYGWIMLYGMVLNMPGQRFKGF